MDPTQPTKTHATKTHQSDDMIMTGNNEQDVREGIPGFTSTTLVKPKRGKRSRKHDDDVAKALEYPRASNPLGLAEQKTKTKAMLATKPEKFVYYPHEKVDKDRCAKIMLNNVSQCALFTDADIVAVANHTLICLQMTQTQ